MGEEVATFVKLLGKIISAALILALVAIIGLFVLSWTRPDTIDADVDSVMDALQSGAKTIVGSGKMVAEEGQKVADSAKGKIPEVIEEAKGGLNRIIDSVVGGQSPEPASALPTMDPQSGKVITPEQAKARMEINPDVIILDVRTQEEYDEKHIPGAVLLPVDDIDEPSASALAGKDGEILVYCRTGVRSAAATKKLVDMGYRHVYNIGGILDWPYETQ